jgi:hypothetical protein
VHDREDSIFGSDPYENGHDALSHSSNNDGHVTSLGALVIMQTAAGT